MTERTYSISDLSREFGVTARAIRFYEDKDLIQPMREGQRRIYTPRDRVRLMLILRGKRLGFSLSEIKDILDLYDTDMGESRQLELLMSKIEERRRALEAHRRDIDLTLAELDDLERQCRENLAERARGGVNLRWRGVAWRCLALPGKPWRPGVAPSSALARA